MEFIETLINGLSLGGTYAMIALGYTMVYGIAKMLNFAHGDIIMVGAYALLVTLTSWGNPWLGFVVAVLFCMILGVTVEKIAYKPLRGASPLAVLITAIGVSSLLKSIAQIIFGTGQQPVPVMNALFKEGAKQSIVLSFGDKGNLIVEYYILITLISTTAVMIALTLFVKKTKTGRAMVAVSEDRGAAQLMGINVNRIIMITFAIGSALAAVAGILMMMKGTPVLPTTGGKPGIKAFTAAVIGGIGSIPGAMLGGILIGFIETITAVFPKITPYTEAIEFLFLIVILLVKPTGMLGKVRREKV